MLDVFFLSFNEPYADENYRRLLAVAPLAKRINGVKGFYNAHRRCAELSLTHNFYVVDADAQLVNNFDFRFEPSHARGYYKPESENLYIWSSKNPVNGLTYGYGGVKLFPKLYLLSNKITSIDFTTGLGIDTVVKEEVSNITAFNYDEFFTWRAAFREVVKLSSGIILNELSKRLSLEQMIKVDAENRQRITEWNTALPDAKFGEWAIKGAHDAATFITGLEDDLDSLAKINDIDWMKNEFTRQYF
jgi:hypothetical protein